MDKDCAHSSRTRIISLMSASAPMDRVLVKGWIRTVRHGKDITFMAVNDGSCLASLQVVFTPDVADYERVSKAGTGACIAVTGALVESPARGQKWELQAENIKIVGDAGTDYPLQKKRHSFEYLRTIAHLRPRSNTFGAVFRMRSALSFAIHSFFQERGFLYLHSPILTTNDCEGAGDIFTVTTLDISDPPVKDGNIDWSRDFFGAKTGLTVSGQLEGEIFASAFSDIYTFGPTFRAEDSNTRRHAAEFWMVEPEMAFADLEENCRLAEDFFRYLCCYALDNCREDLAFFDRWIEQGLMKRLEKIAAGRFETMTYTEAIRLLRDSGEPFEFPVEWGHDLQTEHERYLTEKVTGGPLFVVDYPASLKAFYMRMNSDGRTVAAMDLLVPHVGEIIGGSQREERLDVLTGRMEAKGMDTESLWWFLDLRRWGTCPHSGFGLGFERTIMYVTGMKNIRDVIPFPRTPGNAVF